MTVRRGGSRTTIKQIRSEVEEEFMEKLSNVRLTPAATEEVKEIFDKTIGRFAKRHRKDVWKDAQFKRWILLAARRIAIEAERTASGKTVGKRGLRMAATTIMLKMHGQCPKPKLAGVFEFPSTAKQGEVCRPFLEAQLS